MATSFQRMMVRASMDARLDRTKVELLIQRIALVDALPEAIDVAEVIAKSASG